MNEYDSKTQFYKLFAAENKLRGFAELYQNSYQIGIFACCRQRHEPFPCYPAKQQPAKATQDELRTKVTVVIDDMNDEIKIAIQTAGVRGKTYTATVKRENLGLLFGCRPSLGVLSETSMIKDVIDCVLSRLDHQTLSIELPKIFD